MGEDGQSLRFSIKQNGYDTPTIRSKLPVATNPKILLQPKQRCRQGQGQGATPASFPLVVQAHAASFS